MKNPPTLPRGAQPGPPEPPLDDCASLLRAVSTRLRQAATAHHLAAPGSCTGKRQGLPAGTTAPAEELSQLRHLMLESARALEQLHSSLAVTSLPHHHSLQRQLAQAREELAHTRDSEQQALHLALHDALTELPNRRYLGRYLGRRLDSALHDPTSPQAALALLFIDLNDFKQINDTHGHAVGDELLRIVAARLDHAVRGEDLVCRLGGDEFVLLLTSAPSREQLVRLAQQLIDTIAMPIELAGARVSIRASIGIALCSLNGQTPQTPQALLDRADSAMYRAKRSHCGFAFHEQQALS